MIPFQPGLVASLADCENLFLEVLVDKFRMVRRGSGVVATARFDEECPALWNHRGRRYLREHIESFAARAEEENRKLDLFFHGREGALYEAPGPAFPFRFASGGVLPIVRIGEKDFYCLFYRDIAPVGWNIANGGCASRAELRNPLAAAAREPPPRRANGSSPRRPAPSFR